MQNLSAGHPLRYLQGASCILSSGVLWPRYKAQSFCVDVKSASDYISNLPCYYLRCVMRSNFKIRYSKFKAQPYVCVCPMTQCETGLLLVTCQVGCPTHHPLGRPALFQRLVVAAWSRLSNPRHHQKENDISPEETSTYNGEASFI